MYCNSNTYRTRVRELSLKVSVIFQLVIEVAHDHIDKGEGGLKGTCSDVKKKLLFHFFQTRVFQGLVANTWNWSCKRKHKRETIVWSICKPVSPGMNSNTWSFGVKMQSSTLERRQYYTVVTLMVSLNHLSPQFQASNWDQSGEDFSLPQTSQQLLAGLCRR